MAEATGPRVAELWRYPVKSTRGERLERAWVEAGGLWGDRVLRVEAAGRLVTPRSRRELLSLDSTIGSDGEPTLDGHPCGGEEASRLLERVAPGASLVGTAEGVRFDELPVQLLGAATAAELGADPRRFRPNVLIAGIAPREEDGWVGSEVTIGEVTLAVRYRCERCVVTTIDPDDLTIDPSVLRRVNDEHGGRFGVVCEVITPGEMRTGDSVEAHA